MITSREIITEFKKVFAECDKTGKYEKMYKWFYKTYNEKLFYTDKHEILSEFIDYILYNIQDNRYVIMAATIDFSAYVEYIYKDIKDEITEKMKEQSDILVEKFMNRKRNKNI